ncbi:hypothetical protein Tco_1494105 [Tanacetum coccineum]
MKAIQTFLRKFNRIPFGEIPKVLLVAWERFAKIKHAFTDKQYQQKDIQELMRKLLEDVSTKAITPDLPTEEPDNFLNMGDEHLDTISKTESDKVIMSSVEILVPILRESEDIFNDTCDVPVCEDPSTFNALNDHYEILSDSNNNGTSSDDDDLRTSNVILREKLLNVNHLIVNIESLNDNYAPDRMLKSPSTFPIPITDSDSFFEESDTSFSPLDNSLPKFETFSDHTKETRSGNTTTHANNSLPEYDSFLFVIEPDQGDIIFPNDLLNDDPIPEYERFTFNIKPDVAVINNFEELNEDECFNRGGGYLDFEDSHAHGFVYS